MIKARLETSATRDANGSLMTCTIVMDLDRTEREHLPRAITALEIAAAEMKKRLKEWGEGA